MRIRCQPGYVLRTIEGTPYLLPCGQMIADRRRTVILNETGAFLWNTMQELGEAEDTQLAKRLAEAYQIEEAAQPALLQDVQELLDQLVQMGIAAKELQPQQSGAAFTMTIAGLTVRIAADEQYIPASFRAFSSNPSAGTPDLQIELMMHSAASHGCGQVLFQTKELSVFELPDRYLIQFPNAQALSEAHLTRDGRYVRIYCRPAEAQICQEELFHAVRHCFLFTAQKHGYFALHSASILYREKAWLFSGHSGMGKSTHTALWHSAFGVPYLNGDLNLIRLSDGMAAVYGMPWCGTSGQFTVHTYPLGGIIFLNRAAAQAQERMETLSKEQRTLQILQHLISPGWEETQLSLNLDFSASAAAYTPVLQFFGTKEPSAAHTAKLALDSLCDAGLPAI